MAKRKRRAFKISKFLLGELIVFLILVSVLWYDRLVYQSRGVIANSTDVQEIGAKVDVKPSPTQSANQTPQTSGRQIKVPILMYHYIGNNPNPEDLARDNLSVTPEKFDEQMEYLSKTGYSTITLDTMIAGLNGKITLPEKPVILTFDDGYIDFYFNAFPILQKFGFRSVVFIPTGLIGRDSYLTWEQISKMHSSGLVSFQAHSVNHAHLPSVSNEGLSYEVGESKKILQERLAVPVNFIAYPYGASNLETIDAVKRAGYIGALGTWNSNIQSEGTMYDMPRIKIAGSWDINTFSSGI